MDIDYLDSIHKNTINSYFELSNYLDSLICGIILIECISKKIVYINDTALFLIGGNRKDIIDKLYQNIFCIETDDNNCSMKRKHDTGVFEQTLLTQYNKKMPVLKRISNLSVNGKDYYLESFIDITEQKQHEHYFKVMSETDQLTGLLNRVALEKLIANSYLTNSILQSDQVLIMIDIDYFKRVNDKFGHAVGDSVLKEFGLLLKKEVRENEYVFRWGGEEFLILINETEPNQAIRIAERLRIAIEKYIFSGAGLLTASFGVAKYKNKINFEHWFIQVDYALSIAKQNGRNRVQEWNNIWCAKDSQVQIKFLDSWLMNNETLDKEHLNLVNIANEILLNIKNDYDEYNIYTNILSLKDVLKEHFENEEKFLEEKEFKELEDHKIAHKEIIEEFELILEQLKSNNSDIKNILEYVLGEAIVYHMIAYDMKYIQGLKFNSENLS